jgi:hypothetical protein
MTRPPAAPVGRATLPPMSLDELRAAAERILGQPYDLGTVPDAVALATFVRDLARKAPVPCVGVSNDGSMVVLCHDGKMTPNDARRVAADLLRAAERAAESSGSLPEARVHEEPGHERPGW